MTMYPNQSMLVTLECSEFELNGCCFAEKNIISTGCGFRELFMFCGMLLTKRNIIFLFRLAKS
jgi:hypothetical protein